MPAPLAKGIIITVSVLFAAGLAAYENPHVREWIDRSRQKIAMALHSLGNEIHPRSRSPLQDDPSTREEMTEMAEARRRQARAEIMERGRILEERRRRKRSEGESGSKKPSFETLVDESGALWKDLDPRDEAAAWTTSTDRQGSSGTVASRHPGHGSIGLHESVDSPITLRQLDIQDPVQQSQPDPFADHFEHEMRNAWNLPMPHAQMTSASSHASESLLDLTPTSELAPDLEIPLPASSRLQRPLDHSEYFSAPASKSSHTLSDQGSDYYYAYPENPFEPVPSQLLHPSRLEIAVSVSSAPSVAGSTHHVRASDLEESDDGVISDFGDGVRTPASAWTDVGSVVSNDE